MAKYFTISQGLRGCYMPDSIYVAKCNTRRELKMILEYEASNARDADYVGANKKQVAHCAAAAWREAHKKHPTIYDFAIPYRTRDQSHYPYGIFAAVTDRASYLEHVKECENY